MASSQIDLERKTENAFSARLKQQPLLAKIRMRRTSEDSPKVNQDLVLVAKRGGGNPPFSGVYNLEVTATLSMRHRKTVDTLPQFLALCVAIEEVFSTTAFDVVDGNPVQRIAYQLSQCAPDFHCYEVAVIAKDDTPEDKKHKCVWSFTIVAMCQTYANAASIQS